MSITDVQEVLSRSVGTFIDPDNSFRDKLEKKARGKYDKDIIIKLGIDPTRPDIHLGFAVVLRKLRQFQDLGCKVVFLIGDYTARVGDPTGKSKTRPELEQAEVDRNAATYIEQVGKILRTDDPKVFAWIRNSDWYANISDLNLPDDYKVSMDINTDGKTTHIPLEPNSLLGKAMVFEQTRMQKAFSNRILTITLHTLLWTLKHITHSRLVERDMFQDRLKNNSELYMHEMMYPVLQGIDSYAISQIFGSCDLEVGGTDQTFNMLVGRDVMKMNNIPEQAVLSFEILPGLDGKEKMSKSLDNYIAITDIPNDMYGKVMSVPDETMPTYFKLATYTPLDEVEAIEKSLHDGKGNPRDMKMRLAKQIVAEYHGEEAARAAEANFVETFSRGGVPTDIETVKAVKGEKILDILVQHAVIESKTEGRRLIEDGAVKNAETDKKVESVDAMLEENIVLKVGKRRFLKIETL
jgi:tyrosyl-tRNA synthetase